MARPTPVGARYSPNDSRSVQPHSPVVTPALAQAIDGGMMLLPVVAARLSSANASATARLSRAARQALQPLKLVALGVFRNRHDRIDAAG